MEELKPCPLTTEEKVLLWDAINRYVIACHGDPHKLAYGNSERQRAVVSCEKVVNRFIQSRRAAPENKALTLEQQEFEKHVYCKTCQHYERYADEEPCKHCKGAYPSRYARRPEAAP